MAAELVSINNRGFFNWLPINSCIPPSMTIPEEQKDEAYHSLWMRYFLSRQVQQWVTYYRSNYADNLAYAIDSRFGEEASIRMFLGDGAAQTTRIPFKFPMMSPMLTRLVGAVDNVSISPKAESATYSYVKTRREEALAKAMVLSQAAQAGPVMAGAMEAMGISPDEERTERMFDKSYQDYIISGANSLMLMMAERSGLNETKRQAAMYMALSGAVAFHSFVNGNKIETELIEPREFGWDTSAIKPDLSDGQFMYVCPLVSVPDIAERWQPKADQISALDMWARLLPGGYNFSPGWPQSRPRVFTMYWKDMRVIERGYVMKDDGELMYCTINQIDPDTGKPEYTDKDLVEPPVNEFTLSWTNAERKAKKQKKSVAVLRYCSMIPWEYLPGGYTKGIKWHLGMKAPTAGPNSNLPDVGVVGDMVFEYGIADIQEADPDDTFSVKFPIKASTWRYIAGHVVAPLTAARDPQQWMSQITSDIAYRLRVAGGKLTLINSAALAGSKYDEDELSMKAKEGGVAFIDGTPTNGIANAAGVMDNSPSAGLYNLLGTLPQFKQIAESAVGVYEANYGAPQGQDQLVGTLKIQLQQAGTMQQPYYAAIADAYKQVHQLHVQFGKEFYARRPWILSQMVGDEDAQALIMSEDMTLEQFRVKVDLAPDSAQLRVITDQQVIPQLMQMGMLDPITAAQLLGRSIPDDVYAAAREFTKKQSEAMERQQEDQAKAMQAQALAQEQANIDQQNMELAKQESDVALKNKQIDVKATAPYRQAESEYLKPEAMNPLNPLSA